MLVTRITDANDPRIEGYRATRDGALARSRGTFLAEGRGVVRTAVARGRYAMRSVLVTEAALDAVGADLGAAMSARGVEIPVYVVEQSVMDGIVGFHIHRGCLAEGERGRVRTAGEVIGELPPDAVIVVTEGVNNHDNVGGIFRTAWALGAAAVVIDSGTADPLYRKAIRVSMGGVLVVPWGACGELPHGLEALRAAGFRCVALTPAPDAAEIGGWSAVAAIEPERIALVVGAEGAGLSEATMWACDARVRIAMAPGADSLNVATAAGIALHRVLSARG